MSNESTKPRFRAELGTVCPTQKMSHSDRKRGFRIADLPKSVEVGPFHAERAESNDRAHCANWVHFADRADCVNGAHCAHCWTHGPS